MKIPTRVKRSLSSTSIKVQIDQPVIFVEPSLFDSEPTDDPLLYGSLILNLSRPRAVKILKVTLEGYTSLNANGVHSYERNLTLSKCMNLDFKDELLAAGTHTFNFSFIIPSDTSPSMRSCHGTTKHFVSGTVDFIDTKSRRISRLSDPSEIWIIQNEAATVGETSFHQHIQRTSEFLGPITTTFASSHLNANSLLKIDVSIPNPAQSVTIISITTNFTQAFSMLYKSGISYHPHPQLLRLKKVEEVTSSPPPATSILQYETVSSSAASTFSSNTSSSLTSTFNKLLASITLPEFEPRIYPLAELEAGNSTSSKPRYYSQTNRLPSDEFLRPSTLSKTNSRIKINHKISVSIRYRVNGVEGDKVLTISKKVVVPSCKCLTDSLILPVYVASESCTKKSISSRSDLKCFCSPTSKPTIDSEFNQLLVNDPITSFSDDLKRASVDNSINQDENSSWSILGACGFT